MINPENTATNCTSCKDCQSRGKKSKALTKKARLNYQKALAQFEKSERQETEPIAPKGHLHNCLNCNGLGIIGCKTPPKPDTENYPHIAIIGGGIGGMALAVACLHRQIPFTLYERDKSFDARSQGYGLTLQQASKAIEGLGLIFLKEGVTSTRHVVHTTEGKIIGEWGIRKWLQTENNPFSKRTNIHIARQSLRLALLNQLATQNVVKWNHQLIDFTETEQGVNLKFLVDQKTKITKADLVVGTDGIRSTVRKLLIGEQATPLRYLGCMVILGICPLSVLKDQNSDLLDSATVFQTANGNERIYIMPYTNDAIMWQLSFPISEIEAKRLSAQGPDALKQEACSRTKWHAPIPQILQSTKIEQISGYPVYDRALLQQELLEQSKYITLIGDAAHPMSPFKGQGANQALLDALALAKGIVKACHPKKDWRKTGIRKTVLTDFEAEMLDRTAIKVKDSAAAANFLHSDIILHKGDEPRGRCMNRNLE